MNTYVYMQFIHMYIDKNKNMYLYIYSYVHKFLYKVVCTSTSAARCA